MINQPQTSVTTNNSPRDYTNTDDQPTTNLSYNQKQPSGLHQPGRSTNHKRQSQPTTVLGTTPTRMINQPQTSVTTKNSPRDYINPDDPLTQTSVTTINSPSQDYINPDDQPTTNVSHQARRRGVRGVRTNPPQTQNIYKIK